MSQPTTQLSKKIANLNLDSVIQRLRRDENMPTEDIQQAVTEYKQFLELCRREGLANIVPTVLADKAWHYHILDTRKYAADTDNIFGEFLHHSPNDENMEKLASATERKWRRIFKDEAPAAYQSAMCNP